MAKTKVRTKNKIKPPPSPGVQRQGEMPEKRAGPLPAANRPDLMMAAEQSAGAPGRARQMTGMQQTMGSTRLNHMLGTDGTLQRQPVDKERSRIGAAPEGGSNVMPGDELRRQRQEEQRPAETSMAQPKAGGSLRSGETMIQRRPDQGQAAPAATQAQAPAAPVNQTILDQVIGASVVQTLESFQNIPIQVTEFVPLPAGQVGPPAMVTKTVTISAGYFINTDRARAHYRGRRRAAHFRAIVRELARRGAVSTIRSSRGGELSAGRAVEVGKGTPEDIKLFIEEAIRQGAVRRYARRRRVINRDQGLVDLDDAALQALIQRWVYHVGVGVDCSGFVLQATIRAREAERTTMSIFNYIGGLLGMPPQPLPPERSHDIRNAASFRRGPRIGVPTDLRPGQVWVVRGGGHIRIVTAVREATRDDGTAVIEFDTAESSGGSLQPLPGPVGRTWRTRSRTRFHRITPVGHRARPRGGTFHRVP